MFLGMYVYLYLCHCLLSIFTTWKKNSWWHKDFTCHPNPTNALVFFDYLSKNSPVDPNISSLFGAISTALMHTHAPDVYMMSRTDRRRHWQRHSNTSPWGDTTRKIRAKIKPLQSFANRWDTRIQRVCLGLSVMRDFNQSRSLQCDLFGSVFDTPFSCLCCGSSSSSRRRRLVWSPSNSQNEVFLSENTAI